MSDSIRDQLRKRLLTQRRTLSQQARNNAAQMLLGNLQRYIGNQIPNDAAGYLAVGGEIDVSACLKWLRMQGCNTWLPVVREHFNGQLRFAPYSESTKIIDGEKFNIPEPQFVDNELCNASNLALILVPLVAFDSQGHRLGMGGGYYDRTFNYRLDSNFADEASRQRFVGVAHEFQSQDTVPNESWDVPLDVIVTDQQIHCIKPQ